MEGINGSFLDDEEWESLSKLLSCEEHSENFLLHLNGNMFQNSSQIPSTFLCAADYNESNLFIPSKFDFIPQESSNSSEIGSALFPNKAKENHHDHTSNSLDQSMNFYTMDRENDNSSISIVPDDAVGQKSNAKIHPLDTEDSCKEVQLIKRKYKKSDKDNSSESPKKKPRKNKRNVQPKKNKKADQISNNDDENNSERIATSSSTSNSDDDSVNATQELNSKGKERASRGSANDPQSLYARRRRERINERMKVLQDLVPNGTKVDISTMLEEAVHYVKFLQLQIKLLSSDDLWMYAPIVYNGMDIGLYQKIIPNLCTLG